MAPASGTVGFSASADCCVCVVVCVCVCVYVCVGPMGSGLKLVESDNLEVNSLNF